ncbi:hypothetical protein H4R33_001157 [Dimargaris cristalligena]|uniref:Endoplasmic reticulum-based factor for assembly of V-ATPase-domain-containing protein n=1 Tax=Dimargaris cristalligena TaxID=215637 RepID=A0A4P9ZYN3_9FUNG|nr:hypothetical protein H4R33_001157 [Dimargaris cristalligena]RKP38787.1 endoplasmic reticulum-based factor for assembly of V-ATPase-domain-containing protein [Dimargaris cristalligena]|eukprot:RKP38787.1 endoplasmic reticulum-based factor for assembly of V-ATPase-domain-containing protein [Dimargaris cristalligena]
MAAVIAQAYDQLELNSKLRNQLEPYRPNPTGTSEADSTPQAISFDLLREALVVVNAELPPPERRRLVNVLRGTSVYIAPKATPKRSPEFVAHLESIRAEIAQKDYLRMVNGVSINEKNRVGSSVAQELKTVNQNLMVIFNILFSMVAVYACIYYTARTMTDDMGLRVLFGLSFSFLVGAAEAWLYTSKMHSVELADQKRGKHELFN